jgi:RNA polymerase sigma-70 factor (ECF subfamily)
MTTDDAAQIDRWLEAARQGDERATHQLLEYCRPLIRRYLQGRVRREEDCHDLTQEVLIRVAQALPHLTLRASFEHWLMRIAANCLSRFYSRRWHALEIPFSELPDPEWLSEVQQESDEASLINRIAQQQTQQRLLEIMARVCSDAERWFILLQAQGEPMEAIGQMLRMKANTVRSHLMRGRSKVLAYIVQHEPELVGGAEAIEWAMARLQQAGAPRAQLSQQERDALHHPGRNQRALRRACLKLAPYLPLPFTAP